MAEVAALQEKLAEERAKNLELTAELNRLKKEKTAEPGLLPAASSGPDTNAEHQAVVDALMARIAALKVEKNAVATACEIEEEHITNSLQKQLTHLQNEKLKLEKELQHEHAEHALAMSRLGAAFSEKLTERSRLKESFTALENQLEAEQELILHRMGAQVTALLQERARLKRENERLRTELRTGVRGSSASPAASPRSTPASSPRNTSFRMTEHPPPTALQ